MKKLLLTGGGTLGPVTPLLAIAEAVRNQDDMEVVGFVGTKRGPERTLVETAGIPFFSVIAGKWRRYFSIQNLFGPAQTLVGIFQSFRILKKLQPTIVVSGGGFIGVPVIIAAWLRRIPAITHQEDVRASVANKIVTPFVKRITVTFSKTMAAFSEQKAVLTGNPIRPSLARGDRARARIQWHLEKDVPILFIFGGGTGAQQLNTLISDSLIELVSFCQIIHAVGEGKRLAARHARYHQVELLNETMADAYAVADVVVGRAGIGTITELSALGKPAIIVPISGTHQEANARLLAKEDAAVVLAQVGLQPDVFVKTVKELMEDGARRDVLAQHIRSLNQLDALERVMAVIKEIG